MQHTITKNCLQTILNECLLTGNAKVTLSSTLLDLDLLTWTSTRGSSDRWPGLGTSTRWSAITKEVGPGFLGAGRSGPWGPGRCLAFLLAIASGQPQRTDEGDQGHRGQEEEPVRYPRMRCFAIDTNVAYNRLLTACPATGRVAEWWTSTLTPYRWSCRTWWNGRSPTGCSTSTPPRTWR